ncbi:MAG: STAS domain-containing protein [Ideonella sp.]|nr:STAS domain-containing protein [Ideonella sp.]
MSQSAPISPTGDLTIAFAQSQRQWLLAALDDDAPELRLDLSQLEAFDSAGVQLLLALRHSATARGRCLLISDASPVVRDALKTYALDTTLLAAPGDRA